MPAEYVAVIALACFGLGAVVGAYWRNHAWAASSAEDAPRVRWGRRRFAVVADGDVEKARAVMRSVRDDVTRTRWGV